MANQSPVQISPEFEQRYPNASARATECAMNLVFTADLLVKRISGLLHPFDLSPASGLVLGILADSEMPLPPHEIAERLIISRATVTGLIDSLERRGYARRIPHRSDRRMLLVELTDRGRQVADAFRPIVHQNQKMWLGALSEADQQRLITSLHQLQATLMDGEA
ncbi:MAG TPA: MarR family transcriptional regulator [Anaerolineales bacterium]|nr:MarR family transcriptional regulator [Anaerolineales bacterium]